MKAEGDYRSDRADALFAKAAEWLCCSPAEELHCFCIASALLAGLRRTVRTGCFSKLLCPDSSTVFELSGIGTEQPAAHQAPIKMLNVGFFRQDVPVAIGLLAQGEGHCCPSLTVVAPRHPPIPCFKSRKGSLSF